MLVVNLVEIDRVVFSLQRCIQTYCTVKYMMKPSVLSLQNKQKIFPKKSQIRLFTITIVMFYSIFEKVKEKQQNITADQSFGKKLCTY